MKAGHVSLARAARDPLTDSRSDRLPRRQHNELRGTKTLRQRAGRWPGDGCLKRKLGPRARLAAQHEAYGALELPVYPEQYNLENVEIASRPESGAGISHRNRAYLEELHRRARGAFDVSQATRILGIDHKEASQLLGYLARRGWLSRVRRGLYVAVPLDARHSGEWIEDPWIVADRLFSPCYIGGWSACEHWDLTEQVFRTLLVITTRRVRHRDERIQGLPFHLTVRSKDAMFGTVSVWRGQNKVAVSDPSRTVIDVLDDPRLGGGIRTIADVLSEYLLSAHRDDRRVVDYGDRLGNRTVFKRLGYLLEHGKAEAPELVDACLARRSSGLAKLDPASEIPGRIVRRWGLRVNVALGSPGDEM